LDTPNPQFVVSSLQNPRIKEVIRLRRRRARDATGLLLVEGYRETLRAVENAHPLQTLFVCPSLYQGENEPDLVRRASEAGVAVVECTESVFCKMAYRERPEGLLAVGDRVGRALDDIELSANPLLVVAESIEKPGNLGSILRSVDAAGADAMLVCDPVTDLNNPNTVRASIGTIFCVPVAQAAAAAALSWLQDRALRIVVASPSAKAEYTDIDMTHGTAIVVGAEQVGLSATWLQASDAVAVRIPMRGRIDSLNVASAATLLLYEAARQRNKRILAEQK
jgi:TrmH family RNA methyltransferase